MESLLTSTAETLVIGFALLMAIDFFSGLVHLYRSTPLQTQPHDEPETESAMPEGYALIGIGSLSDRLIVPEDDCSSQTPTLLESACDEIERVTSQPATLRWLLPAIKPDILDATETPNVIEMARVRLHKAQVLSGGQPESDLTELSIRELKKLASTAKIKRYNVMTKNQLIDQLTALDQLSA